MNKKCTCPEIGNYSMWVEAFASTAIEGNELGIRMMGLWKTDKLEFLKQLPNAIANPDCPIHGDKDAVLV